MKLDKNIIFPIKNHHEIMLFMSKVDKIFVD